jgi:hypothetical protein
MINDIGFLIPDNKEDFQLLFKVFEDFPDQNISSRIEALDIFSSGSNAISNEEKYKIAH